MIEDVKFFNWKESPFHYYLLKWFLRPASLKNVQSREDWNDKLREAVQIAVQRFVEQEVLVRCDAQESLLFLIPELEEMELQKALHKFGEDGSGNRESFYQRLKQFDAVKVYHAIGEEPVYKCSEHGIALLRNYESAPENKSSIQQVYHQAKSKEALLWILPAIEDGFLGTAAYDLLREAIAAWEEAQQERSKADQEPLAEAEQDYQAMGDQFFHLNDYGKAIEEYNKGIALDPKSETMLVSRGICYSKLGEQRRAIEDFDRAIAVDAENMYAYYLRGTVYEWLNENRRAIEDYDRAIEINPEYVDAYCNRGIAYECLGEYRRAIEDYDRAIAINPEYAYAYCNRGIAYQGLGEHERAITDYEQAIAIDPVYEDAYLNRGIAYEKLNKYLRAIKDYDRAIAINTENILAFENRAKLHEKLHARQWAKQDRETAERLKNKAKEAKKIAVERYSKAIEFQPSEADLYFGRAMALWELGKYGEAMQDFDMVVAVSKERTLQQRAKNYYEELKTEHQFLELFYKARKQLGIRRRKG